MRTVALAALADRLRDHAWGRGDEQPRCLFVRVSRGEMCGRREKEDGLLMKRLRAGEG